MLALLVALLSLSSVAVADSLFTCQDGAYSWCAHTPPSYSAGQKWPAVFFMPGSGARGGLGNAASLATYDGPGKLISHYASGDKSAAATLAAEKFVTIIPIAPDGSRHFQPDKIKSVLAAAVAKYSIDEDRVILTGYSMGSRGTWRNLVFNPTLWAAGAPSAGSAENTGDGTLSQEAAPAVFPLLNQIVKIPVKAFAGRSDTTAGFTGAQATQAQLQKLGDTVSSLTIYDGADHPAMSTKPWEDPALFQWFLQQSRSGSAPTISTSSPATNSTSSGTGSSSVSAGLTAGDGSTSSSSSSSSTSASSDDGGADDGEDCEDEGTDTPAASTSSADDGEDCDGEEQGSDAAPTSAAPETSEGDDCDEGSDSTPSSSGSAEGVKAVTPHKSDKPDSVKKHSHKSSHHHHHHHHHHHGKGGKKVAKSKSRMAKTRRPSKHHRKSSKAKGHVDLVRQSHAHGHGHGKHAHAHGHGHGKRGKHPVLKPRLHVDETSIFGDEA